MYIRFHKGQIKKAKNKNKKHFIVTNTFFHN